ncbi:MAG: TetR/AcrR family transcriptional regulator [Solirubrobacterales bacterium]
MTSSRSAATGGRHREEEARATRDALVQAGLDLFAARGYAEVGTEEIVARARVTRGALYHHFADKRDLFRAVHERVERELVEGIAAQLEGVEDPWELMVAGTRAFLDACEDPAVKRIALTDAPAVLGWREWREIDARYGLGLTRAALAGAIEAGVLREVPLQPTSHLLVAALAEAAFFVADAQDPSTARERAEAALLELLEGLRA